MALQRRFQAVIFDFGGVITSSPFEAFNRLEAERGLPHNFVRRVNSANPDSNAWARFERAEIDAAAFDALFAAEAATLGHTLDGASVLAVLAGAVRPAMVAALDQLAAAGYRLACITNNVPTGHGAGMARSGDRADALEAVFARFEHVIESSKAGVRKPDPRIYTMMCDHLGVEPEACIYLDDLGINCKPAATLGMHAIKVTSGEQALADLSAVLGVPLGLTLDRASIVAFHSDNVPGLVKTGVMELYADVDASGAVVRELGIGRDGQVVHRHPGKPTVAKHGLFDLQTIDVEEGRYDMTRTQFDTLFNQAT